MDGDELVSPRPAHVVQRHAADRWESEGGRIVLANSMLNASAGWGGAILASMAQVVTGHRPAATVTLVERPQIGDHRPHEWIERLLDDRVAALVVTAGDCATCTSRALRECVLAEQAGIPATAIIPAALHAIADATLDAWGRRDLPIATFDQPLFALRPGIIEAAVLPAAEAAWAFLTTR